MTARQERHGCELPGRDGVCLAAWPRFVLLRRQELRFPLSLGAMPKAPRVHSPWFVLARSPVSSFAFLPSASLCLPDCLRGRVRRAGGPGDCVFVPRAILASRERAPLRFAHNHVEGSVSVKGGGLPERGGHLAASTRGSKQWFTQPRCLPGGSASPGRARPHPQARPAEAMAVRAVAVLALMVRALHWGALHCALLACAKGATARNALRPWCFPVLPAGRGSDRCSSFPRCSGGAALQGE